MTPTIQSLLLTVTLFAVLFAVAFREILRTPHLVRCDLDTLRGFLIAHPQLTLTRRWCADATMDGGGYWMREYRSRGVFATVEAMCTELPSGQQGECWVTPEDES